MGTDHEVIVIGGGAAGLGAAVALARSRRSVLVVDAGEPRNAPAAGVHNFLTREGTDPRALLQIGREELRGYGGQVREGTATDVRREGERFVVTLQDGTQVTGRRIVVTTGLVDELPDVAGLRERWGHDVLHCPYCHGWEVRDQVIGVLASSAMSVHQALLFRQLSDDVTLLLDGVTLDDASRGDLASAGIALVEGAVEAVEVQAGAITGARLADGRVVPVQALVVAPRMVARSAVLTSLGAETAEHPMGGGVQVVVDEMGRTTVPGVYAAGNLVDISAQVMGSAAAGTRVGAAVNVDLIMSDLRARAS
ncbi:MAG: NAD(P)/FAD-dependent oxidoreductase [Marmoricola sp.]